MINFKEILMANKFYRKTPIVKMINNKINNNNNINSINKIIIIMKLNKKRIYYNKKIQILS